MVVTKGWIDALMISPSVVQPGPDAVSNPPDPELLDRREKLHEQAHVAASLLSLLMVVVGFAAAAAMFWKNVVSPEKLLQIAPLALAYNLFSQLWFFDRLYQDGIVPAWKRLNSALSWFDSNIVDATVDSTAAVVLVWSRGARLFDNWIVDKLVDAFGFVTRILGTIAQMIQVGKIQFYVCVTFGVAALLLLGLMLAFP